MKPLNKIVQAFKEKKEPRFLDNSQVFQKVSIDLHDQINQLAAQIQKNATINRMEQRFQDVSCALVKFEGFGEIRQDKIRNWVGKSCKEIFSIGFSLFQNGDLDEKKVDAYCSENILRHILQLSQINQFDQSDFEFLNNFLEKEIIPYFLLKYPLSEDKYTSLGFAKKVIQKNNRLNVENDLIFASQVKFTWKQSGNYNDKIMQFLNYLISLPQQQIQEKSQLYHTFSLDMENLFKLVEVEDEMLKMKMFDPQNQKTTNKVIEKKNFTSSSEQVKELEKYKDKVKSYTQYRIGRKLSPNIKQFSQNEIKSCNLSLQNSALMRVVTKWCQELQECFEQNFLVERQQQFRMLDGSTKFMGKSYLVIFQKLLQRQKDKINKKLRSLMKQNFSNQSLFSKMPLKKEFIGFLQQEGIVGQFCSKIFRNNQSYLVSHLNSLLHGIITATKDLLQILSLNKTTFSVLFGNYVNGCINLDKFLEEASQFASNSQDSAQFFGQVPQIISFLVGDLLRCKCTSHQNQIVALFNQIQRINQTQKGILKVVRVKNRLSSGTKDILLNLMYRNKLVIQMQLAIKTGKTKFLDCSSHFNHYLYELKRSQFGPISQLSNIWTNLDYRSGYFLEKMQDLSHPTTPSTAKNNCCVLQKNKEAIHQPFQCSYCAVYYSQANYIAQNIICKDCLSQICLKCRLTSDYKQSKSILKFLPNFEKTQMLKLCLQLPSQGLLVNLKNQEEKVHYFKKIKFKKVIYIFVHVQKERKQKNAQPKYRIFSKIKNKKEEKIFLKEHYILESQIFQSQIPKISVTEAKIMFFLPEQLINASKIQKDSLSIVNQGLQNQVFDGLQNKIRWQAVRKINFSQNNLKDFFSLSLKFQNTETLVLDQNKISNIGQDCEYLQRIREIYLNQNKIEQISEKFGSLTNISKLMIKSNNIISLPQSFGNLTSLAVLDLSMNKIKSLPQNFGNLKVLSDFNISQNELKHLPETFGSLAALQILNISKNNLIQLPPNFGDLCNLVDLHLNKNKLKTLPLSFSSLKFLYKLDISKNQLIDLPVNLENLSSLTELYLAKNSIAALPLGFGNLSAVSLLDISENLLQEVPQTFANLVSLKKLDISQNQLSSLPQNFGNLANLISLNINKNKLVQLPESFGKLSSLAEFQASKNFIASLPNNFGELSALVRIEMPKNQLTSLPEGFGSLSSLAQLNLTQNYLLTLPSDFGDLKNLKQLFISENQLISLPSCFGSLSSLSTLFMRENKLRQLPQNFGSLYTLKKLEASQNQITILPQSFGNLALLVQLDLSYNKLVSLCENFTKLQLLKKLNLNNNSLNQLPRGIQKIVNLEELYFFGNNIVEIPRDLLLLKKLKQIQAGQLPEEGQKLLKELRKNIKLAN